MIVLTGFLGSIIINYYSITLINIQINNDKLSLLMAASKVLHIFIFVFHQGALVPLSEEILEHLQTEGRRLLAERLALCSGANVKMISGNFF